VQEDNGVVHSSLMSKRALEDNDTAGEGEPVMKRARTLEELTALNADKLRYYEDMQQRTIQSMDDNLRDFTEILTKKKENALMNIEMTRDVVIEEVDKEIAALIHCHHSWADLLPAKIVEYFGARLGPLRQAYRKTTEVVAYEYWGLVFVFDGQPMSVKLWRCAVEGTPPRDWVPRGFPLLSNEISDTKKRGWDIFAPLLKVLRRFPKNEGLAKIKEIAWTLEMEHDMGYTTDLELQRDGEHCLLVALLAALNTPPIHAAVPNMEEWLVVTANALKSPATL
jgi:hypothetical protein